MPSPTSYIEWGSDRLVGDALDWEEDAEPLWNKMAQVGRGDRAIVECSLRDDSSRCGNSFPGASVSVPDAEHLRGIFGSLYARSTQQPVVFHRHIP
jgi:hypothetical protein